MPALILPFKYPLGSWWGNQISFNPPPQKLSVVYYFYYFVPDLSCMFKKTTVQLVQSDLLYKGIV